MPFTTRCYTGIERHYCSPFCISQYERHCRSLASRVIHVPHSAYHNTKPTKMKSQRHTVFRLNLAASFQPHCIIICAVPHSSKAEPWYTHCCYISHHSCSTPFILHHSCCMLHHSCCIIQENPLLLHLTPFM